MCGTREIQWTLLYLPYIKFSLQFSLLPWTQFILCVALYGSLLSCGIVTESLPFIYSECYLLCPTIKKIFQSYKTFGTVSKKHGHDRSLLHCFLGVCSWLTDLLQTTRRRAWEGTVACWEAWALPLQLAAVSAGGFHVSPYPNVLGVGRLRKNKQQS